MFIYKPVKTTPLNKKHVAHKSWTVTDETSANFGVVSYSGEYSRGEWSVSDTACANIALERTTTNGYYMREIFDSIYHLYYTDPENFTKSNDAEYLLQQTRNINSSIYVVSIPSNIFGKRLKENSFTMSRAAATTVYDDGIGNLRDSNISIQELSKSDYHIKCDFNDLETVNSLCEMIPDLKLDVLINNAYSGNFITKHFNKIQPDIFSSDFIKNTIPTILITQSTISYFKKIKRGKIITILTSTLVNQPPAGASSYVANKAYLQSLTKSWAVENKKFNITSNSVSPALMQTKLTSDIDERIIDQIINSHPLKKILRTTEVAETVAFLVNSSQQINGIDLVINSAENIK